MIEARAEAFGCFIEPHREMADLPNLSLVEVDLPEYERNGLGRPLLRVVRYHFNDIDGHGVEGTLVGAGCGCGRIIYADMNPVVVGRTHTDIQQRVPEQVLQYLYQCNLPIELVSLGALRYAQIPDLSELSKFVVLYQKRASWLESHPIEVCLANIKAEAEAGDAVAFDWQSLLPE